MSWQCNWIERDLLAARGDARGLSQPLPFELWKTRRGRPRHQPTEHLHDAHEQCARTVARAGVNQTPSL